MHCFKCRSDNQVSAQMDLKASKNLRKQFKYLLQNSKTSKNMEKVGSYLSLETALFNPPQDDVFARYGVTVALQLRKHCALVLSTSLFDYIAFEQIKTS